MLRRLRQVQVLLLIAGVIGLVDLALTASQAGRVSVNLWEFRFPVYLADGLTSMVLAPLALLFGRPRGWMRNTIRAIGVVVVAAFMLALMSDGLYLYQDSGGHWYPRVHVTAQAALVLAVAISIILLGHIDARDYFRQRQQDASKVWSIESVKQRQTDRS
jgi:hypothetical protein